MEYEGLDWPDGYGDMDNEYFDPGMLDQLPPEILDQLSPELLEELEQNNPELFQRLFQHSQEVDDRVFVLFDSYPDVIDQCMKPVFDSAINIMLPILLISLFCRLAAQFLSNKLVINVTNVLAGAFVLYYFTSAAMFYMLVAILGYTVVCMVCDNDLFGKNRCYIVTAVYFSFLSYCNFFVDPTVWHQVMGPQIVLCMKILSIEFDLSAGRLKAEPSLDGVMGYFFHPATILFGPWVTYSMYENAFSKLDLSTWVQVFTESSKFATFAVVSLLYSSCFTNFLLGPAANIWLKAYFVAQSFRTSHYFVQYLASMSSSVAGFSTYKCIEQRATEGKEATKVHSRTMGFKKVNYVKPISVEFPRSMGSIANNWNLYMNDWFKVYVFQEMKQYGVFKAVFAVYLVSSMLHGAKFQVSAVLLSIGFISYAEYLLRNKLSRAFSACIQSSPCGKSCSHQYKGSNLLVIVTNLCFTLLNVFHLIYLGAPFDNSDVSNVGYNMQHTASVWANLGYSSHYALLFTLTLAKSI